MAKRKDSAALFEVMRAARQAQQGEGTPARTPKVVIPTTHRSYAPPPGQLAKTPAPPGLVESGKKWFASWMEKRAQRRHAAAAAAISAREETQPDNTSEHTDPTAGVTARDLLNRRTPARVEPQRVVVAPPAVEQVEEPGPAEVEAPVVSHKPVTYTTQLATYGRSYDAPPPAPAADGNKVAIDRDRHEVTLRVRFTTAAICVTAVLVVVGSAYIIGKRAAGTDPVPAASKPKPVTQPTNNVLSPAPRTVRPKGTGEATTAGGRQPAARDAVTNIIPSAGSEGTTVVSGGNIVDAVISSDGRTAQRTPGLNYMVIMQYAPDKLEWAEEVCGYLTANGLPCTIEVGSSDTFTNDGWYVLTGTRGFAASALKTNSPEFTKYNELLQRLAEKYPAKQKFNRPQPFMRKQR